MSQAQILALLDRKAAHMDGAGAQFGGAYIGGRGPSKGIRHCISHRVGPRGKNRCASYASGPAGAGCMYPMGMAAGYKGQMEDTFGHYPVPADMSNEEGLMMLNQHRAMHGEKPISMRKFLSLSSPGHVRAAQRLAAASRGFHGPASERKQYVDAHLAGSALIGGVPRRVKSKLAGRTAQYGDLDYTCPADFNCYPKWRSFWTRMVKAEEGKAPSRAEISAAWREFKALPQ